MDLAADTEAVTQAVQFPRPAPNPPVQGEHQFPGYRIVTDAGRGDPIGGVQVSDRFTVPVAFGLRVATGEIEVQPAACARFAVSAK